MTRPELPAGILVFLALIEALVLAHLVLFPCGPESLAFLARLEEGFFHLLAPFSPILLIGLLYGRPAMALLALLARRSKTLRPSLTFLSRPLAQFIAILRSVEIDETAERLRLLTWPRLMLIIAALAGALVSYVPYRPDLNPSGSLVGVDAQLYADWLGEMQVRPLVS